jgi:hypothetical protein
MEARGRLPTAARVAPPVTGRLGRALQSEVPRATGTGLAHHIADLIRSLSDLPVVTPHSPVAR